MISIVDGVQRLSIEENLFEDFIDLDVSVAGKIAEYIISIFMGFVSSQT